MSDDAPQNDAEQLVAYLDGELDDAQAVQVEQRLADRPDMRDQVERLSRTWDLLDLLPTPRATHEFTNRTLTAVRTSAPAAVATDDEEVSTQIRIAAVPRATKDRWKKFGIRTAAFVGLIFSAAAGFRSTYDTGSRGSDDALRNYPVIQRFDEYRDVGSPEFLRQLHESGMFPPSSSQPPQLPRRGPDNGPLAKP